MKAVLQAEVLRKGAERLSSSVAVKGPGFEISMPAVRVAGPPVGAYPVECLNCRFDYILILFTFRPVDHAKGMKSNKM